MKSVSGVSLDAMGRSAFLSMLLVCACGKVNNDTPADANLIDADETGMLSVVTQARFFAGGAAVGAAQPSVDVVSVRPNNTLADMAQTDASGHASLKIYPGGSVTAIYPHPAATDMGADLVTYFGVKPDDVLTFGQRFLPNTSTNLGAMTFTYPAVAAASTYFVYGPCGSAGVSAGTLSLTMTEFTSCHHEPMDIIYIARDAAGQVINYNYVTVPFQAGTNRAITSWAAAKTAMISVTGLPAEVQNLSATFFNVGNIGSSDEEMYGFSVSGQATGGAYTNSFAWGPTGVRTEARLTMSRPGTYRTMQLVDALQSSATTWTVASPMLPPWLQTFTASIAEQMGIMYLVGDGPYDAATFRITWTHVVGSTNTPFVWTFILPPQMTTFTFPKLPAQFAAYLPQPQDTFSTQAHVIEIPSVMSYDALRAIPEKSLICPGTFVPDCAVRNNEFQRVIYE